MVRTNVPQATERLYTIAELAELWGVSRDSVERLLKRGELRYVTVGARRRIPAGAADEYIAERERGTGTGG